MSSAWPDPSSRRRDLAPGGWCLDPPEPVNLLTSAGSGDSSFISEEARPVGQHAMQNDRKLAGERDLGLAHTGAISQALPAPAAASVAGMG